MAYNWQDKDWPNFTYQNRNTATPLVKYNVNTGRLSGLTDGVNRSSREEMMLNLLVAEALKTSEIEGEYFSREDVYSSIQHNLGLQPGKNIRNKKAKGIAELVVSVRKNFSKPLSRQGLFNWHKTLMQGYRNISAGKWRSGKEPMQVVSGTFGREKVHFEAPPSSRLADEMKAFIDWFNKSAPGKASEISNPIIRAAIAHVYFESIHPFEDGNGRIGRAISEKALSQAIDQPVLFSLSKSIEKNKKRYYQALKQAQTTLDLTQWITYFTNLVLDAQDATKKEMEFTIKKAQFFDQNREWLSKRQMKVLKLMMATGPEEFKGGMTAKKYMSMTKTSKATATRDLQILFEKGVLIRSGGGRSVSYQVNI
ncbi:MAG: Fic family protein [Bacteroidota bacterium]